MLGFILVLVYFGGAALAAFVILQPDRFVVTRSAVIDAAPEDVFRYINELRNWEPGRRGPGSIRRPEPVCRPRFGAGAAFEGSGDKSWARAA